MEIFFLVTPPPTSNVVLSNVVTKVTIAIISVTNYVSAATSLVTVTNIVS